MSMKMKVKNQILNFFINNKSLLVHAGLAILLCLTLQDYIIDLFSYLVNHILWKVNQIWGMALIFSLFALFGSCLYASTKRNTLYIQNSYVIISILLALFNFYFRVIDNNFLFWGIIYHGHCIAAWSDVAYILVVYLLRKKAKYEPGKLQHENEKSLVRDSAITNSDEDVFGYQLMVNSLFTDLCATDVENGAFSVGIAGKWGVGKSSFINLLRNSIQKGEGIVVDFYPRSSMDLSAISLDFFNSLSNTLKGYHTGSWHIVDKYVKSLRRIEGEGWFNKTIDAIEVLAKQDEKERLQEVINEIGRRIFVIVDDLDRLTAPEILEVLKIVDRNGSFKNVFFIVAYDKEYVNEVLRKYLGYESKDMFTDKYFNYEFSLPAHNFSKEKQYVAKYIAERVTFGEGDVVATSELLTVWNRIGDSVVRYLGLMRHVKRFINILMSRIELVKNDVNIEDFIYVTLLRYKDLDLYYQLSTADMLVAGKQFLEGDPQLLYLRNDAIREIDERPLGWKDASEVLALLFPREKEEVHYNLENDYRKIRSANAFDSYFFDAYSGKLYHKDLRELFLCPSDEQVINKVKEMFDIDQASLVLYLQSRTVKILGTKENLKRYILILLFLDHYCQRNLSIESLLCDFWRFDVFKDLVKEKIFSKKIEYQEWLLSFIREKTSMYPVEIGCVCMLFIWDDDDNNSILKREELINTTLLCQSAYFKQWEEDNWSIVIAFQLSAIKEPKKNPHKYIAKASEEILKFMNGHVQYFIDNVVNVDTSSIPSQRYTILSINKWFNPAAIFPIDGYSFEKWIEEKVHDEDTKLVLKRIYRESLKSDGLTIKAQLPIGFLNFSEVAKIMYKQDEEVLDARVFDVIQTTIGMDLNTLAVKVGGNLIDVKKSLSRLYEQNKCSQFWLNLKEQMESIQVGDIVRLNEAEYKKVVDSLTFKVNAFVVDYIDEKSTHSMKLKRVDGMVSVENIEAIPIDGIHDLCIYYDPVLAASYIGPGEQLPQYRTDFSYFIEHFKKVEVEGKDSLYDEMVKAKVQFVHEAQHWLKSEFHDDSLKINKSYSTAL